MGELPEIVARNLVYGREHGTDIHGLSAPDMNRNTRTRISAVASIASGLFRSFEMRRGGKCCTRAVLETDCLQFSFFVLFLCGPWELPLR